MQQKSGLKLPVWAWHDSAGILFMKYLQYMSDVYIVRANDRLDRTLFQ